MQILIIGYNRPAFIEMHLKALIDQKIELSNVFFAIDGPKNTKYQYLTDGIEIILKKFNVPVENIFINCHNLGCRRGVIKAIDWFFSNVDEGLILEDDCQIGPTTIEFFNKSKSILNNDRVFSISGSNPYKSGVHFESVIDKTRLASEVPFIWGWYTTKNKWQAVSFENNISMSLCLKLIRRFSSISVAFYILRLKRRMNEGDLDTWDIDVVLHCVEHNLICVYPSQNQICNIGDGPESTNLKISNPLMNRATTTLYSSQLEIELVASRIRHVKPKIGRRLFHMRKYEKIKLFVGEFFYLLKEIMRNTVYDKNKQI